MSRSIAQSSLGLILGGVRPPSVDAIARGLADVGLPHPLLVDAAREAVAGVNLDEEMTNMLSYQHAYSAAARLVTAIDETLQQLITRTGRVGL